MKKHQLNRISLGALLLVTATVAYISLNKDKPESNMASSMPENESEAVLTPNEATDDFEVVVSDNKAAPDVAEQVHPADCAHCLAEEAPVSTGAPFLSTDPSKDYIFKDFAKLDNKVFPRSTFDFLKGTQVGARGSFTLGGKVYSGTVTLAKETQSVASSYAMALDDDLGRLIVTTNAHDELTAQLLFFNDSRALVAKRHLIDASEPQLLLEASEVSEIFCAMPGTVYTQSGLRTADGVENPLESGGEGWTPPTGPVSTIALENNPNSEFVLYLDFDGEVVEGTPWLGGARIDAEPHPRAEDNAFVTRVWERVSEDFAPFNLNVTTDREVYDSAVGTQRLMCVITPTDTAQPGAGGVAYLNSFRTESPVVWTFNLSEYTCATTISHEAGHAFGLSHDGTTQNVEYYPGHNTDYTPGWGPIMGAPFADLPYDAADQWSRGEYTNANNQQDDVAIIGNTSNGFGFKLDDFSDTFDANNVGTLSITGPDQLGIDGIVSRQADIDFFRFTTEQGDVTFSAVPIDVMSPDPQTGSGTAGANLAAEIKMYDATGELIATGVEDGDEDLGSTIEVFLEEGLYYVSVEGAGRGSNASTGFSDYASLGQYSIVGQLPLPPLSVQGGDKLDVGVVSFDTQIQVENGTDFGFSYPAAAPVQRTFLLTNSEPADITDLTCSLDIGGPFSIVSAPPALLPGDQSQFLIIEYDPSSTGVDLDTVLIGYNSDDGPEVFEFTIGGTSTQSATKDNYEQNDTLGTATNLNDFENVWLSDIEGLAFFMDDQLDFYKFSPEESGALIITIDTDYDASLGTITFELFDGTVGAGTEPYITSSAGNGRMQYILPADFSGARRDFYIRVSTTDGVDVRNAYDLRWSAEVLEAGDDDFYEENDTQDQAFDLTGSTATSLSGLLGEGILADEDWYRIDIPADPFIRMFYVRAIFTHADGDINLQVYDDTEFSQFFFETSDTETDDEVITYHRTVFTEDFADNFTPDGNVTIMGVEPGTYYIRVYGDAETYELENTYDLIFETPRDDQYEVVGTIIQDGEVVNVENDNRENAFDLGDTIIDKWLSEVDGIGTSSDYGVNATAQNFINSGDEDWFEFTIDNSEILEQITLEYQSLDGGFMIFYLYDEEGDLLISSTDLLFSSSFTLEEPVGFTYYIRVVSESDISALSGYDFRVSFSSEPPFVEDPFEDAYEENDRYNQTFNITDNEGLWLTAIDGYATMTDVDWYRITVPNDASRLEIALGYVADDGDVNVTLMTSNGGPISETVLDISSETAGNGNVRRIIWEDPIPNNYKIFVSGDQEDNSGKGNIYNLFWDITPDEDNYEQNDSSAQPYDLSGYERKLLRKLDGPGIQADEDWYLVTTRSDTEQLRVNVTFTHADGDIDMDIYNTDGYLVARSISSTDDESIIYSNPVEGDYLIRLHYGNEGNEYDLSWSALNADEVFDLTVGDDEYEENDLLSEAEPLSRFDPRLSNYLGLGTQKDDDWYEIEVPEGNLGLYVECLFTHADGDIDFEIYDSLGYPIFTRDGVVDNEIFLRDESLSPGIYYIRVYGPNVGNDYDLYWVARIIDIYEDNDTMGTAYDLSLLDPQQLSETGWATQGDDDWYSIPATGDYPWLRVTLDYVDQNGAIDFKIIDTLANEYLANSTEDSETLFVPVQAGTNFVHVFGDDVFNIYDLTWLILQDDDYEENDTVEFAADIQDEQSIAATQFDDDWFTFSSVAENSFLSVVARFDDAEGNIGIDVYYSDVPLDDVAFDPGALVLVETSDDEDVNLESVVTPAIDGTYFVRVFGDGVNENYTLDWVVAPDDGYEENDNQAEADVNADITENEDEYLSAVQFDDDWFKVVTYPGEVSLRVDIRFDQDDGDLNLTLYDASGEELAFVDTDTDNESLIYGPDPFGDEAGDFYYVKVGGQNAGTDYLLYWAGTTEDIYEGDEGNNTFDRATDGIIDSEGVRISETGGYATSEDEDWYRVTINDGDDGVIIEITFKQEDDRNVDIELFNASESLVARSTGLGDVERIHYRGNPGDYYLRVFNDLSGNPYDIMWNSYKEDILEVVNPIPDPDIENDAPETPRDLVSDIRNHQLFGNDGFSLELALLDGLTQIDEDWYEVQVGYAEVGEGVIDAFAANSLTDTGANWTANEFQDTHYVQILTNAGFYITSFITANTATELTTLDDLSLDLSGGESYTILKMEDIFIVDLKFEHAQGDLDMAVYDSFDSLIFDSSLGINGEIKVFGAEGVVAPTSQIESTDDGERITIRNLPVGTYQVCVYGYGILPPKDIEGWMPGDFNPFDEDLNDTENNQFVDNTEPGGSSFYTFAIPIARGMGNTYSMRWNSTTEDIYDIETLDFPDDVEVNDDIYHRTLAGIASNPLADLLLIDQYGVDDDDGIVDDNVRIQTFPGPNGILGDEDDLEIDYRPQYITQNLVQFDDDWYEYTVDAGGGEPHTLFVRVGFEHIQGDLGLRVYKASALDDQRLADGELTEEDLAIALVGESFTSTDNETIEYVSATAETYFIQVVGEDLGTPYGLTIRAFLDDNWEENDTLAEADDNANITVLNSNNGYVPLFGVQRDTDYYRMDVPADQVHLFGGITPLNNGEDLFATITDAFGTVLPDGYFDTGVVSPEPQTYYLRVTGDNSGSGYRFSWSFDNVDQYEGFPDLDPVTGEVLSYPNDTPAGAPDLTRQRYEPELQVAPPAVPAWRYLDPIQRLAFDYGLIGNPLWIGTPIWDPFGHAIQEGEDWYAIKIPCWRPQSVQPAQGGVALKRDYPVRLFVDLAFEHADGDINLEVYEASTELVDSFDLDNLPTPIARSERSNLEDGTESAVAAIDVLDEDLVYYVRVYGDNLANDYTLDWSVTEAEDAYEGEDTNNFVDLAYDLTNITGQSTELTPLHEMMYPVDVNGSGGIDPGDGGFRAPLGYGSQTTDDWYAIAVSEGSTQLDVFCEFYSDDSTGYTYGPDNLDIDVEVYFLAGNDGDPLTEDVRKPVLVNRMSTETDPFPSNPRRGPEGTDYTEARTESATFDIDGPGIYFIRVYYDNRTHPYTLTWDDIGDGDGGTAGDAEIIDDYLNGLWSFAAPEDLPINLLEDPYENTDGDRYPNWAEFALLLDPSRWDYVVIGKSIVEYDGEDYFQFEYQRSREAVALGYEFIVEETEDLDFSEGNEPVLVSITSLNAEVERVVYRCTQPMSVQDKCFFRLTVEEPEEESPAP